MNMTRTRTINRKAAGRLLLAAALTVPAGLATAQGAGATPKSNATCTTNTGTLRFRPGLRLTDKAQQVLTNFKKGTINKPSSDVGTLDGCSGIGIAGETGGTFAFKLKGGGNVNCRSIRGSTFTGRGVIRWSDDGSNAQTVTTVRVRLTVNSYLKVTFKGVVNSTYLKGTRLSGTASIPDTLKPAGVGGGNCQNKKRVRNLDYANTSDTVL
jgi:hypothetical protein